MRKLTIITPISPSLLSRQYHLIFYILIIASLLAGCGFSILPEATRTPTIVPSATITATLTPSSTPSATPTLTLSPTLTPTHTKTPTQTPTMAPLAMFTTKQLREGILPVAYLSDTCAYLKQRWSPEASQPGTLVWPIMYHTIAQDFRTITEPNRDITVSQFLTFTEYAHSLGFETITTQQLYDFLTSNAPIPKLSMMLIIDDRRPGTIRDQFMPVLERYNWTVTAAYIVDPSEKQTWAIMDQLYATGRVDIQSHGYSGQVYIYPYTPEDKVKSEIWDSTPVLEQHTGLTPLAFIWPGGDFTPFSVLVAEVGGYKLGFTVFSRGPLMFNWIPQGEPERAINAPLMLLPRAWAGSANVNLEEAVKVSQQAAAFAEQNYPAEAAWYHTYCGGNLTK
ncbi:MAG TPA: polysaccharide deacetylase family protein [Anaerolineales bacterium]|nr:polysaccharide deacetylase family protein [Anaerolineales bacterium]